MHLNRTVKAWLALWCAWLAVPAIITTVALTWQQRRLVRESMERHADRMDPRRNDAVSTPLDTTPPPGHESDVPVHVTVGMYVVRIPDLSIVGSSWSADFYIWFSWDGPAQDPPDPATALNPGETFKLVNGEIASRTLMRRVDDGVHHYTLYRVLAHLTKSFNTARFPRDDHELTIVVEDQGRHLHELQYIADSARSEMSSRIEVSGYEILPRQVVAKPHTYKTSLGDPTLPPSYRSTYSDFVFGIPLRRPTWGLFAKMFAANYIAVALAFAAFLVKGAGERLALTSTALFLAVMNGMSITSLIPDTGRATLADIINSMSYFAIGQAVIQSILYYKVFGHGEGDRRVADAFDRLSLGLMPALAVASNFAVLAAAAGVI